MSRTSALAGMFAVIGIAVMVERWLAPTKAKQEGYSYHAVWRFVGFSLPIPALLTVVIYFLTRHAELAIECGVILLAIFAVGWLRAFHQVYQLQKSEAQNLDKE